MHLFELLGPYGRWTLLAALAIAFAWLGKRTGGVPPLTPGIVALELARTPAAAHAVLTAWGEEGKARARTAIAWDFAFIPVYSALLALACVMAGAALELQGSPLGLKLALPLAGLQAIAALADVLENLAMRAVLDGAGTPWPATAHAAAVLKFTIVCAALGYIMSALGARVAALVSTG